MVWGVTVRLFFLARLAVGFPGSPGFRPGLGRDRPGNFFSKVTREGYLSVQRQMDKWQKTQSNRSSKLTKLKEEQAKLDLQVAEVEKAEADDLATHEEHMVQRNIALADAQKTQATTPGQEQATSAEEVAPPTVPTQQPQLFPQMTTQISFAGEDPELDV